MNFKKIILITLVLFLSASLLTAAYTKKKTPARRNTTEIFMKGDVFITPQIGLNSYAIPFGASLEYAITENIGVGATVMANIWSEGTLIIPEVDAMYHFTQLKVDKLDLFGGVGVGFAIWSAKGFESGSSGIYIDPFVAGRYWFSEKMAVSLRLNIGLIGDWTGVGGLLGVTFKI